MTKTSKFGFASFVFSAALALAGCGGSADGRTSDGAAGAAGAGGAPDAAPMGDCATGPLQVRVDRVSPYDGGNWKVEWLGLWSPCADINGTCVLPDGSSGATDASALLGGEVTIVVTLAGGAEVSSALDFTGVCGSFTQDLGQGYKADFTVFRAE